MKQVEVIHADVMTDHLTIGTVEPRSRRHCGCGCKKRATHNLLAGGVCMSEGCELSMWRKRRFYSGLRGKE